mgnify:CR=1 FL=1|tara:strand:+ start:864 stop:1523 length:660 start_codon:yes stop_codon:yes gene_type:complete
MTDTKKIKQKKFTQEEVDALIEEAVELAASEISLLTDENEELKKTIAEHEATIAELQKKPIKKVRQPKPLEVWEGNLSEFSDLPARSKFTITKKEVMIWVKTPDEIKKITAKRDDEKNKKNARSCDDFQGQCWARKFNKGEGQRCCVAALNGKDYCKTHQTSKLQNGDMRITGIGSIPFNKCLECDDDFNNDKDDYDVKEWFKICSDRMEAFKNKEKIS